MHTACFALWLADQVWMLAAICHHAQSPPARPMDSLATLTAGGGGSHERPGAARHAHVGDSQVSATSGSYVRPQDQDQDYILADTRNGVWVYCPSRNQRQNPSSACLRCSAVVAAVVWSTDTTPLCTSCPACCLSRVKAACPWEVGPLIRGGPWQQLRLRRDRHWIAYGLAPLRDQLIRDMAANFGD